MPPKRKIEKRQNPKEKAKGMIQNAEKQKEKRIQSEYDHLYKEINYGKECVKRHENQWRSMLLAITEPMMRREIECAMFLFERSIDAKDFEISLLLDELNAADEQYARAMRLHVDDIDKILVLCYDQIAELWRKSATIIENLYQAAVTERADIQRINAEHESYLKTMMYCQAENANQMGKTMRGEYLARQEVMHMRLTDIAARFQGELSNYYYNLWKDAVAFMDDYKSKFAIRRAENEDLLMSDQMMQDTLSQLGETSKKCLDTIKILTTKEELLQKTLGRHIIELSKELDYYNNIFKAKKLQGKQDKMVDQEKLTQLSSVCNEVISDLKAFASKGEKLLSIGLICRKFETIEEKTLQYPTFHRFIPLKKTKQTDDVEVAATAGAHRSMLLIPTEGARKQNLTISELEQSFETEVDRHPELKQFWLRLGAMESNRSQLVEECAIVRAENEKYKQKLFNYCEQLSCEEAFQYLFQNPNL